MQRTRLCDVAASGVILTGITAVPVGMLYSGRYDPFGDDGSARRTAYVALSGVSWALLLSAAAPLGGLFVSTLSASKADGGSLGSSSSARARTHLTSSTSGQFRAIAAAAAVAVGGLVTLVAAQIVWLASVFRDGWHGEAIFGLLSLVALTYAIYAAVSVAREAHYWGRVVSTRGMTASGSVQDLEDYTEGGG